MDNGNKQWLINIFPQYMAYKLRGDNINQYKQAENLITGKVSAPSCGCSYHAYQDKVNQLYKEWLEKENSISQTVT